jgi:hypothetical protein
MNITDVTSSVSVSASVCQGFGVRLGKFFSCFQTDVILQRYMVPFIFFLLPSPSAFGKFIVVAIFGRSFLNKSLDVLVSNINFPSASCHTNHCIIAEK